MKTPMTDMFGIDVPIFAFTHCRDVVAAVTKAGGLGVLPGVIETPVTRGFPEERRERMFTSNPAGRPGQPDDVAAAVSYLCSDDAGYVTGQSLSPNGGLWLS